MYHAIRFPENPLIHPDMDEQIGQNINGPSLIRVPDWMPNRLGRYYLYFAHHQGTFIRMAYADSLHGPWTIHHGGVLQLAETPCLQHIASPDLHVLDDERSIRMYYHGVTPEGQRSFLAVSPDGLHFQSRQELLGPFYFRVFQHDHAWFTIAKTTDAPGGGVLLRSPDGIQPFERGPDILPRQRHVAVRKRGMHLDIFYSRGEDCPESILLSTMPLIGDWRTWQPSAPIEILRSETEEEGVNLSIAPSHFGAIHQPVHELRDPAVYEEDDRLYLLYSGAGERNICAAELRHADQTDQVS